MSEGEGHAPSLPATLAEWRTLFSAYADIVLVANSDAVDIAALKTGFGPETLFVFFNKTYKVLDGPFDRPALLVARSSPAGANIVYRREVEAVVQPFEASALVGIANLRASAKERFSERGEFSRCPVGFLDLSALCDGFYPGDHVPTSGFALALWLAEQRLGRGIHLAGFTARRSARWKLFRDHDWSFEQTALKLLHRGGLLTILGRSRDTTALQRFAARFPEVSRTDVAHEALEVLGERLANAEDAVDRLISVTRLQTRLRDALQALKPMTRKERLARSEVAGTESPNALAKSSGSD